MYKFFEVLLKLSTRLYFKNKFVTGKEKIPKGKPLMFVANHPGAFMDPIVIGAFASKSLYYIARGESFKNKIAAWFFKRLHMIPVYRKEETPELTHKNDGVFKACYSHFEKGRSLMIFPEGTSKIEHRLRKVKSGAARIALGAEAKNNFELDLEIVPVGLTYSNPQNFRTDVHVDFGTPIKLKDWQAAYEKDSFKAAKQLTKEIESRIKEQMLLIENQENDLLYERLHEVYFEEMIKRFEEPNISKKEKLNLKNELVKAVEYFKEKDPEFSGKLERLLEEYCFEVGAVAQKFPNFNKRLIDGKKSITKHFFSALFGFPFFLAGFIANIIPYKVSGILTEKFTQRDDFTGGLRLVIGTFAFLFNYIGWLVILNSYLPVFLALIITTLLPVLGMLALGYSRMYMELKAELFYQRMVVTENKEFKKMLDLRSLIIDELEQARLLYNERVVS